MEKTNQKNKQQVVSINLRTYAMVAVLILVAALFGVLTKGTFFTPRNLSNLFRAMSITAVIGIGMVMIMVSGNIDLSVGAIVALCGGIAAILQVWYHWPTWAVVIVSLILGAVLGCWSGYWVAFQKLPAFIVTLGSQLAFRGTYLVISQGITITPISTSFANISQSYLPPALGIVVGIVGGTAMTAMFLMNRRSRKKYGFQNGPVLGLVVKIALTWILIGAFVLTLNQFKGIPTPVMIVIVLAVIFIFITTRTRFGRRIYAIGGNQEAARLSGINVRTYTMVLYIIMGFLSAISGIMLTARLDGATAAAGTAYETDVISAVVIGGTSMAGGKGTIAGALIGALIIASLDNGMSLLNITYYYQNIVKGLVLILAIWLDVATRSKKS